MSLHLIRLRWLPKNHGYYTPVSQNPQELPDFTYLFVPNYPYIRQEKCYKIGNPGTSMSKLLSRRSRDFFTGIPNIYSASPDLGAPLDYVRACSSHHNEVEQPQSPGAESGHIIPPIVTHSSCLSMSPDSFCLYVISPSRSFARLRPRPKPGRGRKRAKDRPVTPPHARVRNTPSTCP